MQLYTNIYSSNFLQKHINIGKNMQMLLTLTLYSIGIMMFKFSALYIFNNFYNNLDYYL